MSDDNLQQDVPLAPTSQESTEKPKKSSFLDKLFKKKDNLEKIKEEEIPLPIEGAKEGLKFEVTRANPPPVPKFPDKTKVNFRYPLIIPYAYAHIYWDEPNSELIYKVEEPDLTDEEKEIFNLLEKGVKELINISFISVKDEKVLIEYLEKNIRILLDELNITIEKKSYLKVMYYIYRNFIGLNKIESLMADPNIEDIECNGVNSPIYLVHRSLKNIKTNIIYPELEELQNFVEKLAQKCGRNISYSDPLLDGTLPDKSRVNATFTQDISSKGPTFSIRKFTKIPFTPIKLMEMGTVSPEFLAYIWLLIENGMNILIVGGTGSGKTTLLNSIAFFIPPQARIISIEDSVTGDSKIIIRERRRIKEIAIKEFVEKKIDAEVMTINKSGLIEFAKPSKYIKHKVKKDIYEITTSTGRRIKITKDHSLFSLGEEELFKEVKPEDLMKNKSFIAVPRRLPISCEGIKKIDLTEHLNVFNEDFIQGKPLEYFFKKYSRKELNVSQGRYNWWKKNKIIKIKEFIKTGYTFNDEEKEMMVIKTKNRNKLPLMFKINENFIEFLGLWLGDGSYDNRNKNVVIISNQDDECRKIFKEVSEELGSKYSVMNDKGVSQRIHSTIFYKFMRHVLGFEGYSSTKKIPDFVLNLSSNQLKHFIKGYFSADGTVKKYEVSCTSQSRDLLDALQGLLLRFGIIGRISKTLRKDKCLEMSISGNNIEKFKEIGFLQERKNQKIMIRNCNHDNSDIIPLSEKQKKKLKDLVGSIFRLETNYKISNVGRRFMTKIAPVGSEFNDLSHNDILWDKVVKIKKLPKEDIDVFDLSIPEHEKFLCNNIFVHNTREIQLIHENWLPGVTREGVGQTDVEGKRTGEISLFDLLKESFRQRPDYVIVGEIRGKEAFVLFQGMASGHSCASTMHANDVATVITRLETPPINLSASLVESLDAVIMIGHATIGGVDVRKVKTVEEVIKVGEGMKGTQLNTPFIWNPKTNRMIFSKKSYVFEKIIQRTSLTPQELYLEFNKRANLLFRMYQKKISNFEEVQKVIHEYYKNPEKVLKQFGLEK